jgi:hypothetical protein
VQLVREEIVNAKYNMDEWVDLAFGMGQRDPLDLNEEPMEGNDVDDQATTIVKLPQARENAQLLSDLVGQHSLEFSVLDVMQSFKDELNKIYISNINKQ